MILGIEGGGSQTRIVAEDATGKLQFRSFDTSIKFRDIGVPAAVERLARIVEEHYAGPTALAIALAGAANVADRIAFAEAVAKRLGLGRSSIFVDTDSALTLRSCPTTSAQRIVLISGTGSIAIGADVNGVVFSVGGWGPTIGDEGSGRAIGREALAHLTRVLDRRERSTRLSDALTRKIGLHGTALEDYLKSSELPVASFARVVFETHSEESERMLEDATRELAQLVQAVLLRIAHHSSRPEDLFLSGSVAKSEKIQSRLKRHLPLMRMVPVEEDAPARTLIEIARGIAGQR